MQKIYYECNKCKKELQVSHCDTCDSDNVVMIIFNGTNKIPVRYVEEKKVIEPIKENVWDRLKNV